MTAPRTGSRRGLFSWVRGSASRASADGELDAELRAFLDLLIDEKIQAGADPAAARREALGELGGAEQVKERVRDVRPGAGIETLVQDVRYAVRGLARRPLFPLVAVGALALGIGANTAIFTVVNGVLLRPLPYRDPDRLAVVLHHGSSPVAPANYVDWRAGSRAFAEMGAAEFWTPNLTGGDRPESIDALRLTQEMFPLLGVRPLLGRVFLPEEGTPGRDREAVLSFGLWQRRFGGDRNVIGRTILLNGEPYSVIGIMPESFRFAPFWATRAALWAPLALAPRASSRSGSSLRVFARLAPGISFSGAQAEISAIASRLERLYPGTNRDVRVVPLKEKVVGDVRPALSILSAAVGFVLLIACANVAHMLLARAASRRKEVVIRMALGASQTRLVRQFLTESVLLALAGGAAGLVLAFAATRTLIAASGLPGIEDIGMESGVFLFTTALSVLAGLAFGIVPALQVTRGTPAAALREFGRGDAGAPRRGFRTALMASEFALALLLLVGAGLMIRSFLALRAVDPGFDPRGVLTMRVSVAGTSESAPVRRGAFYRDVLRRVGSLPGVVSVSAINHLPLAGDLWGWPFTVEGRPAPARGDSPSAAYRVVFPGYFRTMGLPLVRGRDFAESDRADAPPVVIINEFFARTWWPGEDAVGKRITFDDLAGTPVWVTIVGVARDAARGQWAAPAEEELYLPIAQTPKYLEDESGHFSYVTLVVKTAGDPASLAPAVRGEIRALDARVPVSEVMTMEEVVAESNAKPRFYLLLLGTFAAVAVLLAAVGIYGVISFSVARRTQEIGIRMALGARRPALVRLIVGEGLAVALAGAAVGLAGALAATRLMSGILYGVSARDPVTFGVVPLFLAGVAVLASYIPARRATRIDPLSALRSD